MRGVEEGPEEGHSDRLDLLLPDKEAHGTLGGFEVERLDHFAFAVDALADAGHRAVLDKRPGTLGLDRILDALLGKPRPATIGAARD